MMVQLRAKLKAIGFQGRIELWRRLRAPMEGFSPYSHRLVRRFRLMQFLDGRF